MPLYEYVCRDCDAAFEKLVRRFDEDVACPACTGASVEKQLSTFAVGPSAFESGGRGACGESSAGCGRGACGDPTTGCRAGAGGGGAFGLPS